MSFILRIMMLPLLVATACGVVIIPLGLIQKFTEPSLETMFAGLALFGLWPLVLAITYGAFFIEHFMIRSISKEFVGKLDMLFGKNSQNLINLSFRSGDYFAKALDEHANVLDNETIRRGRAMVNRHKAITRFIWPGLALTAISGIGLALLQVLEKNPVINSNYCLTVLE